MSLITSNPVYNFPADPMNGTQPSYDGSNPGEESRLSKIYSAVASSINKLKPAPQVKTRGNGNARFLK